MNALKLVGAALCVAASTASLAQEKNMPDAEYFAVIKAWKLRCTDLAVAENRPSLQMACINGVMAGIDEVAALGKDDTISAQMWDTCKAESGFNYSNDFHAWAACMRIARTRPGLRNY